MEKFKRIGRCRVNEISRAGGRPAREHCIYREILRTGAGQTLGAHLASKIFHGGLDAAAPVRDAQRLERHLDRPEHAEHHRRVDVAHVRDPERAALQLTNPAAEDDAALLAAVVAERAGLVALHQHGRH